MRSFRYGWHFPEMGKIVTDNIVYAKVARKMGFRTSAPDIDFSETGLPEDQEADMKEAAQISMGTEISDDDIKHVSELCDQVVSISEYPPFPNLIE